MKYYLEIEVASSKKGIFISQQKTGQIGCVSLMKPLLIQTIDQKKMSELFLEPKIYQRLMGHLIYLLFTRLDIAYVVIVLSQFMHVLTRSHLEVV